MSTGNVVVVGIDPSLTATGVATPDGVRTFRSRPQDSPTLKERHWRLDVLSGDVGLAVGEAVTGQPEGQRSLVVIETPVPVASGHAHDRSGLWWLIVDAVLMLPGVDVVEVNVQSRMKYATGKGRADKDEVLAEVVRRYTDVPVANNNEADALVLRAMGMDALGRPIRPVPARNREALAKIAWPGWMAS